MEPILKRKVNDASVLAILKLGVELNHLKSVKKALAINPRVLFSISINAPELLSFVILRMAKDCGKRRISSNEKYKFATSDACEIATLLIKAGALKGPSPKGVHYNAISFHALCTLNWWLISLSSEKDIVISLASQKLEHIFFSFIRGGVNINANIYGQSLLHHAINSGNIHPVLNLIRAGAIFSNEVFGGDLVQFLVKKMEPRYVPLILEAATLVKIKKSKKHALLEVGTPQRLL